MSASNGDDRGLTSGDFNRSDFNRRDLNHLLDQVKFGVDGLATAVAIDAVDGKVLMLAHMNREALQLTLTTGTMTYWSRSRKEIWVKGLTSGNKQTVIDASIDCDGDALLFRVKAEGLGAACHEGYRSCFFRLLQDGEWKIQGQPLS